LVLFEFFQSLAALRRMKNRSLVLLALLFSTVLAGCGLLSLTPFRLGIEEMPEDEIGMHIFYALRWDEKGTRSAVRWSESPAINALLQQLTQGGPVRKAVIDPEPVIRAGRRLSQFSVEKALMYQLNAAFRKGGPFVARNIHQGLGEKVRVRELLETMPERAMLLLATKVFLTPDHRALQMETSARLYLKKTTADRGRWHTFGKLLPLPIYANTVISQTVVDVAEPSGAVAAWLDDGGEALREALVQAVKETAYLFALDINGNGRQIGGQGVQTWKAVDGRRRGVKTLRGSLIFETDHRYVIRLSTGQIMSLPRQAL